MRNNSQEQVQEMQTLSAADYSLDHQYNALHVRYLSFKKQLGGIAQFPPGQSFQSIEALFDFVHQIRFPNARLLLDENTYRTVGYTSPNKASYELRDTIYRQAKERFKTEYEETGHGVKLFEDYLFVAFAVTKKSSLF
ncbi:MAG: hypothetical protein QNK11_09085 [Legionella sp.]|nr:hypothetical protein [Legionella sp.]